MTLSNQDDEVIVDAKIVFGLWPAEYLLFQRIVGATPPTDISCRFLNDMSGAFVEAFSSDDPACYPIIGGGDKAEYVLEKMDAEIDRIAKEAVENSESEVILRLSVRLSTVEFLESIKYKFKKDMSRCLRYLVHFGYLQAEAIRNKQVETHIEFCLPVGPKGRRQFFLEEVIQLPRVDFH